MKYNISYSKIDFESTNNEEIILHVKNEIVQKMPQLLSKSPYYNEIEIDSLQKIANNIKKQFTKLVVVGMGGAILNSKNIVNLIENQKDIEIIFLHKVCFNTIKDIKNTAFIFISNSGNTVEVIEIAKHFYNILCDTDYDFSQGFIFAYGNSDSLLHKLHKKTNGIFIEYDKQMGGRFSTFTKHNLLIYLIANIDIYQLCEGANKTIQRFLNGDANDIIKCATILKQQNLAIFNGSYSSNCDGLVHWYSTALAETLGKNNSGICPVNLDLPIDQHGLMQAILTNQTPQLVNIFVVKNNEEFGDLISLLQNTLVQQFKNSNISYRAFYLHQWNAETIGELIMHLILETITAAVLLNLEPFIQPQIDNMKKELARNYAENFSK